MSSTPIDNLLRLAGEEYADEVRAALSQAWDEGRQAMIHYSQGARHRVPYPENPYAPVRYP